MHLDSAIDTLRRPTPGNGAVRARPLQPAPVDLKLSVVVGPTPLRWRSLGITSPELGVAEIVRSARAVQTSGAFLICGGEPLVRSDIWQLLGEIAGIRPAQLGLWTSGRGIDESALERLRSLGVQRVMVPFHSARQDAHDWLVGEPGALKTAHRAIRACVAAELAVTAEIVLTRSTMPHLSETLELLAWLGVRTFRVRRLTAEDVDVATFVSASARMSLLRSSLEEAAAVALRRRLRLTLHDFPVCVAPRLHPFFAAPGSEAWVQPDGSVRTGAPQNGCPSCAGAASCGGAPADYVARFGWEEFAHRAVTDLRVGESVPDQQAGNASQPMTFSWQGAARVRCVACAETTTATVRDGIESTRSIRARLVQAAQHRPAVLRLVGADLLAHPQSSLLVFDAVRLFRHVEVAGEASAIAEWSELDLRRLKDLKRIDVALYGPDAKTHDEHCGIDGAFATMQRAVERLRSHTSIAVGAYAVLHDARLVTAFAEAWEQGLLPGEPRFRLSAQGSRLDELIDCARALPPGAARAALAAVLPACQWPERAQSLPSDRASLAAKQTPQQQVQWGRPLLYRPCGSDPMGEFTACPSDPQQCTVSGCLGTPVGWESRAR